MKLEEKFIKFNELAKIIKDIVDKLNELLISGYNQDKIIQDAVKYNIFECRSGNFAKLTEYYNELTKILEKWKETLTKVYLSTKGIT